MGDWTKQIWKLRKKYSSKYPDLFSQIHFTEREPAPPYSQQVSDFFVYQAFGGITHVLNPAYERFFITEPAKEKLLKRNEALINKYGQLLRDMAKEITPALILNPDPLAAEAVGGDARNS